MEVGGAEALRQLVLRLVREEPDVGQGPPAGRRFQTTFGRPVADEEEEDVGPLAEEIGRGQGVLQPLAETHVARVHHEELAVKTVALAERVGMRARNEAVGIDPVRDTNNPFGQHTRADEALAHVPAEDDHTVGLAVDGEHELPKPSRKKNVGELSQRHGNVRVDVLEVDHELRPTSAAEQESDQAQQRRVGLGDDDIGARDEDCGEQGSEQVRYQIQ